MGEPVMEANGATAVVVAVRSVPGDAAMWDLTVATVHTFAVGSGQFVVHNCGDPLRDKATGEIDDSLTGPHIQRSAAKRGWTRDEIRNTIQNGDARPTADITGRGKRLIQGATRYTDPVTDRAVSVNNETGRIVQLGDRGFRYDTYDLYHDVIWRL